MITDAFAAANLALYHADAIVTYLKSINENTPELYTLEKQLITEVVKLAEMNAGIIKDAAKIVKLLEQSMMLAVSNPIKWEEYTDMILKISGDACTIVSNSFDRLKNFETRFYTMIELLSIDCANAKYTVEKANQSLEIVLTKVNMIASALGDVTLETT